MGFPLSITNLNNIASSDPFRMIILETIYIFNNSLFSHNVTRYPYLGVRHYGAPRQRNLMQISSHFFRSSHESRNTFRFDHGYFTGKLQ